MCMSRRLPSLLARRHLRLVGTARTAVLAIARHRRARLATLRARLRLSLATNRHGIGRHRTPGHVRFVRRDAARCHATLLGPDLDGAQLPFCPVPTEIWMRGIVV